MDKKPTKTACRPRRPRSGSLICWLLLGVLAAGCTTARLRGDPQNIAGNLKFRNPETVEFFHSVYRSGNLYQDFRPVMVVDSIFESLQYRAMFVRMLEERFLIAPEAAQRMEREQQETYGNRMDFLVLVWGGSNDKVDLHKAKASWKVFLRDDEGQLLSPSKMELIGKKNPIHIFLQKHFIGLDRWSELVRVSFPKLDKALLGREPGAEPFQLIVTGIPGTVTLNWEDSAMFYSLVEEKKE